MIKGRITNALLAILISIGLNAIVASPVIADENAPLNLAGCDTNSLEAGNDAFASALLGFSMNVGDSNPNGDATLVNEIFISENGIASFDNPVTNWYNGFELNEVVNWFGDAEVIAPLYADAVRNDGGSVTWGQINYAGRAAFCIKWNDLTPSVPEFTFNPADIPDPLPKNSFELVIVSRADRAAGDVDVIVNYESIQWDDTYCAQDFFEGDLEVEIGFNNGCGCNFELDEECFGPPQVAQVFAARLTDVSEPVFPYNNEGALAGLAFSNGFDDAQIEFPGSGRILEMVDADGLAAKSLNSLMAGRFIIKVENGLQDYDLGAITGNVFEIEGNPIESSIVEACTTAVAPVCALTRTDANGNYQIGGAAEDQYIVTAHAPVDTDLTSSSVNVEVDFTFTATQAPNITLTGPTPPPENVDFGPTSDWGTGTTVYWGAPLDLSITGCVGGTAIWTVTAEDGPSVTGSLSESSEGTYTGVIPPLNPTHGIGAVSIDLSCPDPANDEDINFDVYIDPSGAVTEVHSGEPIAGATVVLSRSDLEVGPFEDVADGSDIMSPSNRQNPFVVGDNGLFGWDTVAGYYIVTATAPGCHLLGDESINSVQTDVLPVQPEWLGLSLQLDCNNPPEWVNPELAVTLEAPINGSDLVAPGDTIDLDPTDVVAVSNDAPASLPLGQTTVNWTVIDPDGASSSVAQIVTVVDTTPPTISVSGDITVSTDNPDGIAVLFDDPVVTDTVDPNPNSACFVAPILGELTDFVLVESGDIFPIGISVVTCAATDVSGNDSNDQFIVTVELLVDEIPPVVSVPEDIAVDANSAEGSIVDFATLVSATDETDGDVDVICTPASGSLFAASTSTAVNCTAVDAAGNEGSNSFNVIVGDFATPSNGVRATIQDIVIQLGQVQGLSNRDQAKVNWVISRLSLLDNDKYWADGNNLTDSRGLKVMSSLRASISSLGRVRNSSVKGLRNQLLTAMITLTQNRIAKAEADGGSYWLIRSAKWRANWGIFFAERGYTSYATWYLQSAWQKASRAS